MTPAKPGIHEDEDSYLFRVEILVNGRSSGAALEHLLRVLNQGGFTDYRIGSGIGRGHTIQEATDQEKKKRAAGATTPQPNGSAPKHSTSAAAGSELEQRIRKYIDTNKLVRLNVYKGRGVRVNMPCRILNFDVGKQLLTVYHEDEKQVHSFKLFEIEDFIE